MSERRFLIDRSTLLSASIEDLEALLVTYPYCSLYRVLLVLKAKIEGHPRENEWLESAAIYVPDRAQLFQIYKDPEMALTHNEVAVRRTKVKPVSHLFLPETAARQTPLPKTAFHSWSESKPTPLESPPPPAPSPPKKTEMPTLNAPEAQPKATIPADAAVLAEKSVKKNDEIVSETLAKVFIRQGNIERAIDIYQKLSLKFPEKSTYFAGLIRALTDQKS